MPHTPFPFLLAAADPDIDFSLVVPCYNEEDTLPRTIPPLLEAVRAESIRFEMILVRNGSRDETGRIIESFIVAGHPVRKVDVETNIGYGWGLIQGMRQARGTYVGFMGCDGQIKPADVCRAWRLAAAAGPGMLIKVRRIVRNDGIVRWLVSRLYNLIFLAMFGAGTLDVNGAPKILHRDALERIAPESRDWFLDAEIVIKSKRIGLRIVEEPVDFMQRAGGRTNVRFSAIFEFLRNMLNARLRW